MIAVAMVAVAVSPAIVMMAVSVWHDHAAGQGQQGKRRREQFDGHGYRLRWVGDTLGSVS
jgi:hypothetical protein